MMHHIVQGGQEALWRFTSLTKRWLIAYFLVTIAQTALDLVTFFIQVKNFGNVDQSAFAGLAMIRSRQYCFTLTGIISFGSFPCSSSFPVMCLPPLSTPSSESLKTSTLPLVERYSKRKRPRPLRQGANSMSSSNTQEMFDY